MHPAPLLTVDVVFAAAHRLAQDDEACRGLHGHNYRLRVTARQAPGTAAASLVALRAAVQRRVWTPLDHTLLNEQIEDPTAERVAGWIWDALRADAPSVVERDR